MTDLVEKLLAKPRTPLKIRAAHRIKTLEAEVARLTQERDAATAAAYEAVAREFEDIGNVGALVAKSIRALATPDQTAALDRVRAEAKAEGMREASEHAAEFVHRRLYEANMPACSYHSRDIKTAILAAIPKQEQRHD